MQHTRKLHSVALLVLLLFSARSYAQNTPTLFLEDQTVDIGQAFSVDVQVENYSHIISTSFSLEWDSTVIEFTGVDNMAADIEEDEHFGFTRVASGILTFSWYDESLQSISIEDGNPIFTLNFEARGMGNTQSELVFSDTITTREIADTSFNAVTALFEGSTISVAPSSTPQTSLLQASEVLVHPMPFEEKTYLEFSQPTAGKFSVSIIDVLGKVCFNETHAGTVDQQHRIELSRSYFPASGTYFVRLVGDRFECSKPIVIDY